jgi:hypothetical protein
VGWGFLKNMKHKQNNDSAVLEEKRIVFFMSIPESNGKEFSPEEALKNLRENVDTVDKKTIIKSLEALQNIPDLPPKIQQGLRDSAKNIDHMSAVDRAKFRQALERIQPFLEAAEKQHDFHKQNVISVLEKYAALLPSEVPVVEKWKKDISLTADDQKILDFAIKRMVGENTDGWAQLEIKKQNQSEKNRLELWFAIKSGMYLLGMEPEEIQKKLNKKMPEYTEENRENLSFTEKLSQANTSFNSKTKTCEKRQTATNKISLSLQQKEIGKTYAIRVLCLCLPFFCRKMMRLCQKKSADKPLMSLIKYWVKAEIILFGN